MAAALVVLDEVREQLLDDEADRTVQVRVERARREEVAHEAEDAVERRVAAREVLLHGRAPGGRPAPGEQHDRDVVGLRRAVREHVHGLQQPRQQVRHRAVAAFAHDGLDARGAEHRARGILGLEDAVGDQREHVAGLERDATGRVDLRVAHEPHRERRRLEPLALAPRGAVVQQRALPRRVVRHDVLARVEQAEERRDEVFLREVLDELVVDLREDGVEVGPEPQRDAQHSRHLGRAQRGTDAVAGRVAQQHEQATLVERDEVERVAAGLVRRAELPGHVVLGEPRHLRRQRAHLDLARELDLAVELLRLHQRARHALALDEHDALRGQRLGDALVLGRERGVPLAVDHLQDADELRALDQRHRQHAADVVVQIEVDGGVEQRFGAHVGDVDDLARARREPEDALRELRLERRGVRVRAGEHEHGLFGFVEPHRRAFRTQDAAGGLADLGEHGRQVERRRELAGHLEYLQQRLRAQPDDRGPGLWRHRHPSPAPRGVCPDGRRVARGGRLRRCAGRGLAAPARSREPSRALSRPPRTGRARGGRTGRPRRRAARRASRGRSSSGPRDGSRRGRS